MINNNPLVSIGLPVYNGEDYLRETIDAILAQTYPAFELIISDNASTDETETICRGYAAEYQCIRYYRNEENIGGFRNNNQVMELALGEYFMLAGHDDLRSPEQLSRCVEILEQNRQFILAYSKTTEIDEHGNILVNDEVDLQVESSNAHERFRDLIRMDHKVEPVYGLIRSHILGRIKFGQFADADRVFVAELGLRGPFYRISEPLFFRRVHPLRSTEVYRSRHARTGWFDPAGHVKVVFPYIREFSEYLAAINRAELDHKEKLRCYAHMRGWFREHWREMADDLRHGVKDILRPWLRWAKHV
jgi:glycosyltransferase involved in cell wall biosynthesis